MNSKHFHLTETEEREFWSGFGYEENPELTEEQQYALSQRND